MRAILINPWNQTVEEVDHNGDYRDIYTKLSFSWRKVETFDSLQVSGGRHHREVLYLDGEGFLSPNIPVFYWMNYPSPLAGCGLILGADEVGETIACEMKLEPVRRQVLWSPKVTAGTLHGAGQTGPNSYTLGTPQIKDRDQ